MAQVSRTVPETMRAMAIDRFGGPDVLTMHTLSVPEVGANEVLIAVPADSDLEKHFIRAETIRWDQLLEAGSEANARAKGTLRLEGKDYIVQDGDVMHIRHSG